MAATHSSIPRKALSNLTNRGSNPPPSGTAPAKKKGSGCSGGSAGVAPNRAEEELYENRALLHRVLREKQQLLSRCRTQTLALEHSSVRSGGSNPARAW